MKWIVTYSLGTDIWVSLRHNQDLHQVLISDLTGQWGDLLEDGLTTIQIEGLSSTFAPLLENLNHD